MSIMDKIWRRFAFYPICRGNPTTNQTTGLCCRCVSYNVCLPLSFFRDILPSPKHTQQQHTPYNLIQLFRSTLRPANAMWSLIKPQNVAVCELLKTIPFGGCQKIWRFVDVNASSCATRTNFCGVRFVLIDNCWNRSRLVFRARCHFAIMARRLGVLKQQQPLAVFVDLNLIMFPARKCIRRMDRTIWWGWNALKAIVGLVLRVVSSNLAMIYSHLMRVRGITGKSMGGWKKGKPLATEGRKPLRNSRKKGRVVWII